MTEDFQAQDSTNGINISKENYKQQNKNLKFNINLSMDIPVEYSDLYTL